MQIAIALQVVQSINVLRSLASRRRFPLQSCAKIMPKYTLPMNWHYKLILALICTEVAHFLLAKSKSVWFGIFHSHQYAGAGDAGAGEV